MIREGDLGGWLVAAVFGAFALTGLVLILPGATYLRLTPEGFTICSLYRKSFIRWTDVQDFRVVLIGRSKMVGFDYAPHYTRTARLRRRGRAPPHLQAGRRQAGGADDGLPGKGDGIREYRGKKRITDKADCRAVMRH